MTSKRTLLFLALLVAAVSSVLSSPQLNWNQTPWIGSSNSPLIADASDLFRTTFTTPTDDDEAATIILHIAALGVGFARINGQEVSEDRLLLSGWTDNEQRVLYSSYDVSDFLAAPGAQNVLAVAVGTGYRDLDQFPRRDKAAATAGDITNLRVLRAQLVRAENSSTSTLLCGTGFGVGDWWTTPGPWLRTSIYDGEIYDARLEIEGWDSDPTLDYSSGIWTMALSLTSQEEAPRGEMAAASSFAPIRVTAKTAAISVTKVQDESTGGAAVYVVDFGVNRAGVVEMTVPSSAADVNITLLHGEILAHDMLPTNDTDIYGPTTIDPRRIYRGNLRTALAADSYAASPTLTTAVGLGALMATHTPRMTYHGFRYVEIHNWPTDAAEPTRDTLVQLHQRSDLAQRTAVSLPGQPVLETVFNLSLGAQRSNLMSVATDCPQRDERLAWTGDLALSADSMAINFEGFSAFARSTLAALQLSQNGTGVNDGSIPDVVPFVRYGSRPGDVSWSAVMPALVWALYQQRGDLDTAAEYFDALVALQRNVSQSAFDDGNLNVLEDTFGEYGDWCPPPPRCGTMDGQGFKPSRGFTSAYSLVSMTQRIAALAKALERDDASSWAKEAEDLRASFDEAWLHADSSDDASLYDRGLQSNQVLGLALMGPQADGTEAALRKLADALSATAHHLSTGIIGTRHLFDVLLDQGSGEYEDLALEILGQVDYPSYGFMAFNHLEPATDNVWELFSAPCEGNGMNSRNHHMFSSAGAAVARIAGLDEGGRKCHSRKKSSYGQEEEEKKTTQRKAEATRSRCRVSLRVAGALGVSAGHVRHDGVSVTWQRHGGVQCAKAPLPPLHKHFHHASTHTSMIPTPSANVSCGEWGGFIQQVAFASFGRPTGGCGRYTIDPHFHDPASVSIVERACLGKKWCLLGGSDGAAPSSGGERAGASEDPLGVEWAIAQVQCGGGRRGVTVDILALPGDTEIDLKIPSADYDDGVSTNLHPHNTTLNVLVQSRGGTTGTEKNTDVRAPISIENDRKGRSSFHTRISTMLRTEANHPVTLPILVTTLT